MNWSFDDNTEYKSLYKLECERFRAKYATITWRNNAISIIENKINEFISKSIPIEELSIDVLINELLEFLYDNGKEKDAYLLNHKQNQPHEISAIEVLTAEASANFFSINPTEELWIFISKFIWNNEIAFEFATNNIKNHIEENSKLEPKIIAIADKFVSAFLKDPTSIFPNKDKAGFKNLSEAWQAKPKLSSLRLIENYNQYFWPQRCDFFILDLIFEINPKQACILLEKLKNPYQIDMILSFCNLSPNEKYNNWVKLMKFAQPAFNDDNEWNGALLAPLLLNTAEASITRLRFHIKSEDAVIEQDIVDIANDIASIIWQRTDAKALSFWWAGQLFRSMVIHSDKNINNPNQLNSKCFEEWQIIQALTNDKKSISWIDIKLKDIEPDDNLCYYAITIVALNQNNLPLSQISQIDPFSQLIPNEAEDFLDGDNGAKMRKYCNLYTGLNSSPDSFALQILTMPLVAANPRKNLKVLWHKTVILREIVEHAYAYSDDYINSDISSTSSSTIWLILALGINLLDFIQDKNNEIDCDDKHSEIIGIFKLLHDAINEMMSICKIGQDKFEVLNNHLCIRRCIYDLARQNKNSFNVLLSESQAPTLGDILFSRCNIDNSFFDGISMLMQNGVSFEYIKKSINQTGIDFDNLIKQTQRLNEINGTRKISLHSIVG